MNITYYTDTEGRTLHAFVEFLGDAPTLKRTLISKDDDSLLFSILSFKDSDKVEKHSHAKVVKTTQKIQECWMVLEGKVEVELYDTEKKKMKDITMLSGDALICYDGGHAIKTISDGALMYEIKNGPYTGDEETEKWQ